MSFPRHFTSDQPAKRKNREATVNEKKRKAFNIALKKPQKGKKRGKGETKFEKGGSGVRGLFED